MAAAQDLFYRMGIHSVSVEMIAATALTNKMTLYRHFKSKDALIAAYVQHLAHEGEAQWDAFEIAHPSDPGAQIDAWLNTVEDRLKMRGARGCAIANAAVELPADHPAREIIEDYKLRKRNRLRRLLREAHYAEPDALADEIFLLFEGAQISLQCAGKNGPASKLVGMVRSLLVEAQRRGSDIR